MKQTLSLYRRTEQICMIVRRNIILRTYAPRLTIIILSGFIKVGSVAIGSPPLVNFYEVLVQFSGRASYNPGRLTCSVESFVWDSQGGARFAVPITQRDTHILLIPRGNLPSSQDPDTTVDALLTSLEPLLSAIGLALVRIGYSSTTLVYFNKWS